MKYPFSPYYSDLIELKQAVVSAKLTSEDLIRSRKDYEKQHDVIEMNELKRQDTK